MHGSRLLSIRQAREEPQERVDLFARPRHRALDRAARVIDIACQRQHEGTRPQRVDIARPDLRIDERHRGRAVPRHREIERKTPRCQLRIAAAQRSAIIDFGRSTIAVQIERQPATRADHGLRAAERRRLFEIFERLVGLVHLCRQRAQPGEDARVLRLLLVGARVETRRRGKIADVERRRAGAQQRLDVVGIALECIETARERVRCRLLRHPRGRKSARDGQSEYGGPQTGAASESCHLTHPSGVSCKSFPCTDPQGPVRSTVSIERWNDPMERPMKTGS